MNEYELIRLTQIPLRLEEAAQWFSEKWGVPLYAYRESMNAALAGKGAVPQWYLCLYKNRIVGGMGVIERDFHDRPDLTPNVCAVYVEPAHRGRGLAGRLLSLVCEDMKVAGIKRTYLVTDHTSFYERYGWRYLCMVRGDDGEQSRMYIRETE